MFDGIEIFEGVISNMDIVIEGRKIRKRKARVKNNPGNGFEEDNTAMKAVIKLTPCSYEGCDQVDTTQL